MKFPSINPAKTKAWQELTQVYLKEKNLHLVDLFNEDPNRKKKWTLHLDEFEVDFSKNRITPNSLELLLKLAKEVKLEEAIEAQFSGGKINQTENRAVLHTSLRDFNNMKPIVKKSLKKMKKFSKEISSGKWKGYTGKKITDVVNIGIGGSDLGPKMVNQALSYYKNHLNIHYLSNVDGDYTLQTLNKLNPETTLFIIVSKSFGTQETLANANTARNWFLETATQLDIERHFVAVSSNIEKVSQFGICEENIFPMWDWVGGRFSLWSAVGLSICCAIGYTNFEELLQGANQMDQHFKDTPFNKNIPVILALISIYYSNFFNSQTEAIIPYSQYLENFVPYLQQATMESNGKSIDRNNDFVNYTTSPIIWGNVGSNAQHAFFQLLHQGSHLIPIDFIGFSKPLYEENKLHPILMANFLAQSEALLQGTYQQPVETNHRYFCGNRPSNTILIHKLTPKNLGKLIALYEHKVFVQGVIWNIYSFDQWGVELGKKLAKKHLL